LDPNYQEFKATYGKTYQGAEHDKRAMVFQRTLDRIAQKHADGDDTAGVTKFADLSPAEFQKRLNFRPSIDKRAVTTVHTPTIPVGAAPASADWRNKSAVTPVKVRHTHREHFD
jgi:hypothetical protein